MDELANKEDLLGGGDTIPRVTEVKSEESYPKSSEGVAPTIRSHRSLHTITQERSKSQGDVYSPIDLRKYVKETEAGQAEYGAVTIIEDIIPLNKKLPNSDIQDTKIVKYKCDDNYLQFVQAFTNYCESRKLLKFDGSIFFDDGFFPRSMLLSEFVPINVIAPFAENLELIVPSCTEYCKFAPCGSTVYSIFQDYNAIVNREHILRNQVSFILNSLQCPKIESLEIDSTSVDERGNLGYPSDRLSSWHESLSSFICRHTKSLKFLHIKIIRDKNDLGPFSNHSAMKRMLKRGFPKLQELAMILWDTQLSIYKPESDSVSDEDKKKGGNSNDVWMSSWFPDAADQYWISLMKSQLHGTLTKLCWVSAAKLCWEEVFQPIIYANKNSLECIHIIEITGMLNSQKGGDGDSGSKPQWYTYGLPSIKLSCGAFAELNQLKILSLRKTNCCLIELDMLPHCIEDLSLDDVNIRADDIVNLKQLPNLKILRLANIAPACQVELHNHEHSKRFGVDKEALKILLHIRSLDELCVWRHCLGLDVEMEALSNRNGVCDIASVLHKINTYLSKICKSSQKIVPSVFCEWNSKQDYENKILLESLDKIGFFDEECIVIHDDK